MKYTMSKERFEKIARRKIELNELNKPLIMKILNKYFEGDRYGHIERRIEVMEDRILLGFVQGVKIDSNAVKP